MIRFVRTAIPNNKMMVVMLLTLMVLAILSFPRETNAQGPVDSLTPDRVILYGGTGDQRGTDVKIVGDKIDVSGHGPFGAQGGLLLQYQLDTLAPTWDTNLPGTVFYGVAVSPDSAYPLGVAVPPACGATDGAGDTEGKAFLAHYTAAGALIGCQAANYFNYRGGEAFVAGITALDANNAPVIYAVGSGEEFGFGGGRTAVAWYDGQGNLLGKRHYGTGSNRGSSATDVMWLNNRLVVVGNNQDTSPMAFQLDAAALPPDADPTAYSTTLAPDWAYLDNLDEGRFMGVTAFEQDIIAVGFKDWTRGSEDYLITRLRADGTPVWVHTFGGPGSDVLTGAAVVNGRLFVSGYTSSQGAGQTDGVLLEIDPANGQPIGTTLFGAAEDDRFNRLATDGNNLYLVGESRSFGSPEGNQVGSNDVLLVRYALGTAAAVNVSLSAPQAVLSGNQFQVTVEAQNADAQTIAGVALTVPYPAATSFVDASPASEVADCLTDFNDLAGAVHLGLGCASGKSGPSLQLWALLFTSGQVNEPTSVSLAPGAVEVVSGDVPPQALPAGNSGASVTIFNGTCGDGSRDGVVGILDVTSGLQIASGLLEPDPFELVLYDVDRDSQVTVIDAADILKSVLGKLTISNCGPMG